MLLVNGISALSVGPTRFCVALTGLRPDTPYAVVLRACSAEGCGASSAAHAITACSAPAAVAVRLVRAGSSELEVAAGDDGAVAACRSTTLAITHYQLPPGVDGGGGGGGDESGDGAAGSGEGEWLPPAGSVTLALPSGVTSATLTGLEPLARYAVLVVATNAAGQRPGAVAVLQTLPAPPAGVGAVEATAITVGEGAGGMLLQWPPPTHPYVGAGDRLLYDLLLDGALAVAATPRLLAALHGLVPATRHAAQLRACNTAGCADGPSTSFTTPPSAPTGVGAPTVRSVGARNMEVTWAGPAQANGALQSYALLLQECREDGGPTDCAGTVAAYEGPPGTTTAALADLQPYTLYRVRLAATTAGGTTLSSWTATLAATRLRTLAASPEVAGALSCGPTDVDAITCDWAAAFRPNAPLLHYRMAVLPAGPVATLPPGTTRHTLAGLVGGGERAALSLEVRAVTTVGTAMLAAAVALPVPPATSPPATAGGPTTAAAAAASSGGNDALASGSVAGIAAGAVVLLILLLLLAAGRRARSIGAGKARALPFWIEEHDALVRGNCPPAHRRDSACSPERQCHICHLHGCLCL